MVAGVVENAQPATTLEAIPLVANLVRVGRAVGMVPVARDRGDAELHRSLPSQHALSHYGTGLPPRETQDRFGELAMTTTDDVRPSGDAAARDAWEEVGE